MASNEEALAISQEVTHSWSETFSWDISRTRTKTFRKTIFEGQNHQLIADLRFNLKYLHGSLYSNWSLSGLISLSSAKHRPSSQVISWYLNLGKNSFMSKSKNTMKKSQLWVPQCWTQ